MKRSSLLILACLTVIISGCSKDDVSSVILSRVDYDIVDTNGQSIGTATFTEDSNKATEVLIELTGSSTSTHPAFIRYNSAAEGGPVALTLKACECSVSHTVVSKLDNGPSITFDGLLILDGHISIQQSATDPTVIATANIGSNSNQVPY